MRKLFCVFAFAFFAVCGFSATMNSKVRKVPKEIQEKIFIEPEETLPKLVNFLVYGAGDVNGKVKVLHDWICDNIAYDTDIFSEKGVGKQDYKTVLKKRKGVCVGYANLFAAMCFYAKIETEIIPGWSKGFGYRGKIEAESDHAWNAVKIGSRWQLIDVTWDAGFVDYKTFIKRYSTSWLYLTPSQFIYSHLPEEEKWQLLPQKDLRTPELFEKEPYIPGIFFEYGLSFGKDMPRYHNALVGVSFCEVTSSKNGVSLIGGMHGNGQNMNDAVFSDNIPRGKRFYFDVPDKAQYEASISARLSGFTGNPLSFAKNRFESSILPSARGLLSSKKITAKELELFEASYFLVDENEFYYFAEDLFDNTRNTAVTKILKLLELNTNWYEEVISFNVHASDDYDGYGKISQRFPKIYAGYVRAGSLRIVSPTVGVVKKGEECTFAIDSKAFSSYAIVLPPENNFNFFTKNPKDGTYTLTLKIPDNVEEIPIYASKDGKSYESIFEYKAE